MVKSGRFIVGAAQALGLAEPTVAGAFRVLRESGLMTSGARGVNAPDMTDLDAARILIAMLVSERPAYAEGCVRDFGQLVCIAAVRDDGTWKAQSDAFNLEDRGLGHRHTFERAVAELIRMFGDDQNKAYWERSQLDFDNGQRLNPGCRVTVQPSRLEAEIRMVGNVYYYEDQLVAVEPEEVPNGTAVEDIEADPDTEAAHELKRGRYATAIQSVRSVGDRDITALARMLRTTSA